MAKNRHAYIHNPYTIHSPPDYMLQDYDCRVDVDNVDRERERDRQTDREGKRLPRHQETQDARRKTQATVVGVQFRCVWVGWVCRFEPEPVSLCLSLSLSVCVSLSLSLSLCALL
jgi:hypothetical protein